MSIPLACFYIAVCLFWAWSIYRDGGIGAGPRFLYGFNLTLFFLFGPAVSLLVRGNLPQYGGSLETAAEVALIALAFYVAGAYWVAPAMLGQKRLIPAQFWEAYGQPVRLVWQWGVIGRLLLIGLVVLPLNHVFYSIATLCAVWSQVNVVFESALVMMCLNGVAGGRPARVAAAFGLLACYGMLRAALTGFFGWTLMTGTLLVGIVTLGRQLRIRSFILFVCVLASALFPYHMWLAGRSTVRQAISRGASLEERLIMVFNLFQTPSPAFTPRDISRQYKNAGRLFRFHGGDPRSYSGPSALRQR